MKYLFIIVLLGCTLSISAQAKLPVIKASSKKVAINDGGYFEKDRWTLSPKAKPDIFIADRTRKTKWVTFYTDIDSIRVKVKPGTRFNFVILLNGRDSCYTQIASAIPPENKLKNNTINHDTIPFTVSAHNAIAVKAVLNNSDTVTLHFDLSSFDIRLTKTAILTKTHLLSNQPDAVTGKAKPNYNQLNKVTKLQMGSLVITNPDIFITELTARDMDGRFSYNIFEGKTIEINYDLGLLIIHSKLPKIAKGYARSKLGFKRSFDYVTGTFEIANKKYTGDFLMDTGSEQAIILDSTWATAKNFPANLKLIKTLTISDPRGVKYETRTVLSPAFTINKQGLTNIPTLILSGKNPVGFPINYLGNDVLKRFNMILDLKNDYIYLKPDKLMGMKYRDDS